MACSLADAQAIAGHGKPELTAVATISPTVAQLTLTDDDDIATKDEQVVKHVGSIMVKLFRAIQGPAGTNVYNGTAAVGSELLRAANVQGADCLTAHSVPDCRFRAMFFTSGRRRPLSITALLLVRPKLSPSGTYIGEDVAPPVSPRGHTRMN